MSEREIAMRIEEMKNEIAKVLFKGKDVELRKDAGGIKVISVDKKVVAK